MVDAVAALQADVPAVLVGEHPPAVDLLLVDAAVAVEGLGDLRRNRRRVLLARAQVGGGPRRQCWPSATDARVWATRRRSPGRILVCSSRQFSAARR